MKFLLSKITVLQIGFSWLVHIKLFRNNQGSGERKRQSILSDEVCKFINDQLKINDELTSTKLQQLIEENWPGIHPSKTTIKRERRRLGWVCTRAHYCQLLHEVSYTNYNVCVTSTVHNYVHS